jgi:hypothetical protein
VTTTGTDAWSGLSGITAQRGYGAWGYGGGV